MSAVVLLLPVTQVDATQGRAVVTASVTNSGATPQRIVLAAFPPPGTPSGGTTPNPVAWTTVDRPLREIAAGATEQFTVTIAPPAGAPTGRFPLRFIAYSADSAPEENADQARQLEVTIAPGAAVPASKKSPWWIYAVAAALVVIVGVVAFQLVPRPTPAATVSASPSSPSSPPTSPPPRAVGEVVAYSLNDYTGDVQKMPVGTYDDVDAQLTVGNDAISSLKIPKGLVVRAYEHAWLQGAYRDFIEDTPALPADWNDRISSLAVFETADGPPRIDYAVGLDYPWAHWLLLPVGDYPDLARTPLGADTLGTLLVPPGLKVTLYDQANFAGERLEVTADTLDLGTWSDRAGSAKVTRR
jgi:hypothetical protein